MTQPNTIFSIQTGASPGSWSLSVEDHASGTVLVDLTLTAEQAYRLFQGGGMKIRGRISRDLTHIGQYMHTEKIDIPTPPYGKDAARLADEWMATGKPSHWESYRVDHTNHGYVAVGHWWNDDPGDRMQWAMIEGEDDDR